MVTRVDRRMLCLLEVTVKLGYRNGSHQTVAGRGGGIRTRDPLLPKQMRYQAALRPDIPFYGTTLYFFGLFALAGSSRRYAAAAR